MRLDERPLRPGIYRSRRGVIFGVCRGVAEHFNFSVFWARAIAVIAFIFTGFWPVVGLYLIAALLMKPAPVIPLATDDEQEFYDSYASSRHLAVQRLKRRYRSLERRLQRMEHIVTSREFEWDEKLNT